MTRLLLCCALSALAIEAHAASLDSSLQSRPTLGSEIKRGGDAQFQCNIQGGSPLDVRGVQDCVQAAQSANEQSSRAGYDAFDAGLYFSAWSDATIAVDILESHPDDADQLAEARQAEEFYWHLYLLSRHKIDVSDRDVVHALEMTPVVLAATKAAIAQWGD